ncbi:hypothetical protein, partial [Bacillus altitudinis]|uniref:hypothetical protein n=1 Tax=Bacillus altitudinis TaxID=293387 RepID=UPI001C92FE91
RWENVVLKVGWCGCWRKWGLWSVRKRCWDGLRNFVDGMNELMRRDGACNGGKWDMCWNDGIRRGDCVSFERWELQKWWEWMGKKREDIF